MGHRHVCRERVLTSAAEHLTHLIRIPSVSLVTNRPVIAYASSILSQQGWTLGEDAYIDESGVEKINLIAAPPGQNISETVVNLALLCHTDTVPYAHNWRDALNPILRDNALHGCGACDVKGFLACLLAAVESQPARQAYGVRIILTADEEIGCLGSKRLVAAGLLKPRRMVIGEPTSLSPARAGKGYCLAHIIFLGREAHSSLPGQGLSAIYAAAHFVSAMEQFAQELAREENAFFNPAFTTINIGKINSGTAKNIIPGRAELLLEWRPIPDQSKDRVPAFVHRTLMRLEKQYPGLQTVLDVLRQDNGFETPAQSELVQYLENATDKPALSIPFGSEASAWSKVADEIVVFGPGDMSTAHSERECVSLEELEMAVQTINQLLQLSWANGNSK